MFATHWACLFKLSSFQAFQEKAAISELKSISAYICHMINTAGQQDYRWRHQPSWLLIWCRCEASSCITSSSHCCCLRWWSGSRDSAVMQAILKSTYAVFWYRVVQSQRRMSKSDTPQLAEPSVAISFDEIAAKQHCQASLTMHFNLKGKRT